MSDSRFKDSSVVGALKPDILSFDFLFFFPFFFFFFKEFSLLLFEIEESELESCLGFLILGLVFLFCLFFISDEVLVEEDSDDKVYDVSISVDWPLKRGGSGSDKCGDFRLTDAFFDGRFGPKVSDPCGRNGRAKDASFDGKLKSESILDLDSDDSGNFRPL